MRDDHEAYIEARVEFARVYGGTKAEIMEQWEVTKTHPNAFQSRVVLLDGTTVAEMSAGDDHLRRRVTKRLAERKWDDEDADLVEQMAELLGMKT